MPRAFVIRPFGKKPIAKKRELDFDLVHELLIKPALEGTGYGGGTTAEIKDAGNIREDMFGLIIEADLIVCDITIHNANVFYELGVRHSLRKGRTILIKGKESEHQTPFDLLTDRYLAYEVEKPADFCKALIATIRATMASERETDSPVFKMLPALQEVNADAVKAVPNSFAEEVARAVAAGAPGWLRLLADEVEGMRFEWPALRLIGKKQWTLKDYDSARRIWERVADGMPGDIDANWALSNIYERLYRGNKNPELLERSNQAIAKALRSRSMTPKERAEALSLEARNLKTLWRLDVESVADPAKRRHVAMSGALIRVYERYRTAFREDLNHFWSGLAALQMGAIVLALAELDSFGDAFDTVEDAATAKDRIKRQGEAQRLVVAEAIDAELQRLKPGDPNRVWAEISRVDLRFLTDNSPERLVAAYRNAVPHGDFFAWDAVRGQLRLFRDLGFKAEAADAVIQALDPLFEPPQPSVRPRLILFAGHQIDLPGRDPPRFPAHREDAARRLIRKALEQIRAKGAPIVAWASAAPGGDILFHEVCQELGIESRIYLPMPKEVYARLTFVDGFDSWRGRFFDLVQQRDPVAFGDHEDLPDWLVGSSFDPWERGNRWMLAMAQAAGAERVTLLALWDGKAKGFSPGGTGHMIQIAREAGTIDIVTIDAKQLVTRPRGKLEKTSQPETTV